MKVMKEYEVWLPSGMAIKVTADDVYIDSGGQLTFWSSYDLIAQFPPNGYEGWGYAQDA